MTDIDPAAVQLLLEASADYFELVMGRPPSADESHALLSEGPEEGVAPRGKVLLGIRSSDDDELVGILDAFADYPGPGIWYIGLLLLAPTARRGGLGREVVESLALHAKGLGANEIQINVVAQNQVALQFWTRIGFAEIRRWTQAYGRRTSTFIRMARPI